MTGRLYAVEKKDIVKWKCNVDKLRGSGVNELNNIIIIILL